MRGLSFWLCQFCVTFCVPCGLRSAQAKFFWLWALFLPWCALALCRGKHDLYCILLFTDIPLCSLWHSLTSATTQNKKSTLDLLWSGNAGSKVFWLRHTVAICLFVCLYCVFSSLNLFAWVLISPCDWRHFFGLGFIVLIALSPPIIFAAGQNFFFCLALVLDLVAEILERTATFWLRRPYVIFLFSCTLRHRD